MLLSRFRYMPVPLHQFLSPPSVSMLTPKSWPHHYRGSFLLGSWAAQEINYHNMKNRALYLQHSYRRKLFISPACQWQTTTSVDSLSYCNSIFHMLLSIQGMQAHGHPTTLSSYFNQTVASTVIDMIAYRTDYHCEFFIPLASTGTTRS